MFEIAKNIPNPRAAQCCANCIYIGHPWIGMGSCIKYGNITVIQIMTCESFEMNFDADVPAIFAKHDEEMAKLKKDK